VLSFFQDPAIERKHFEDNKALTFTQRSKGFS